LQPTKFKPERWYKADKLSGATESTIDVIATSSSPQKEEGPPQAPSCPFAPVPGSQPTLTGTFGVELHVMLLCVLCDIACCVLCGGACEVGLRVVGLCVL